MSGTQIGGVVGGAIGFVIGGPQGAAIGMSIGGTLGGALMPDKVGIQDQQGQRLSDLKVTTSTYGVGIARVYGAYRIGGNTIWSTDIIETKHVTEEEVGKGGGSETYEVITYSYDVSFAVALCEGPVTGIRKVWADSVLIYDGNAPTAFYSSSEYTSGPMDFYLGEADQAIDWSMQSYNTDTPAYRNVCYIRFNNLQLEKFGNRVPNITAEVVFAGENATFDTLSVENMSFAALDADVNIDNICAYNFIKDYGFYDPQSLVRMTHFDGYKTYVSTHAASSINQAYSNIFIKYTDSNVEHLITHEFIAFEGGCRLGSCTLTPYYLQVAFSYHKNTDGGFFSTGSGWWGGNFITYHENPDSLISYKTLININLPQGDTGIVDQNNPPLTYSYPVNESNDIKYYKGESYFLYVSATNNYGYGSVLKGGSYRYPDLDPDVYYCFGKWNFASYYEYGKKQEGTMHAIIGSMDQFPSDGSGDKTGPISMDIYDDTIFLLCTTYASYATSPKALIKKYTLDGVFIEEYDITTDLNLASSLLSGHNCRFFVADSAIHVLYANLIHYDKLYVKYTLDGQRMAIRAFGSQSPSITGTVNKVPMMYHSGLVKCLYSFGLASNLNTQDWTINLNYINSLVNLKTITDDLCRRSGLNPSDYDNSAGALIPVEGFAILQNAKPRESIASLQSLFLFDYVEDEFSLKINHRDGVASKTIAESNIVDGTFDLKRKLETELPRKITLNYSNKDFDYLTGSQMAMRTDVSSDNNVMIDMPLTIGDTEAKQLVEKILYTEYTGKTSISFRIPFDETLSVSDVITLTHENFNYNLRIEGITVTTDYVMDLALRQEGSSQYISNAIGSDTTLGFTAPTVNSPQYSYPVIFNAPTFSNDYLNTYGIYYNAYGTDSWKGSQVYKSKDLGQTYNPIGAIFANAYKARGSVITLIGTAKPTVWDLNDIDIALEYGTLYSKTLDEVLAGGNYIMIGNEVMQYADATLNLDGSYTLSNILRGRRGTEWAIDSHTYGELFMFLDTDIKLSSSTINIERDYRAVTFGSVLDESSSSTKATYDGTNLKPFSPEYLQVVGEVITWVRRDRYISGYFRTIPNSEIQERYKVELFYLGVSVFSIEVINTTTYTYNSTTYPNVDTIQVSQYSDNLMEFGYIAEINI